MTRPNFAALALVATLASGCNFIFNPANSDEVIRCKNPTECEAEPFFDDALRTNRVDAACAAPGGGGSFTSSKTNQVCSVVDKASISCAADMFGDDKPLKVAWDEANKNKSVYTTCGGDKGSIGCEAKNDGTCNDGEPNEFGTCDNGSGENPLVAPNDTLIGQDVLDQHCRSFFCDDSFVCDRRKFQCVRCDPELEGLDQVGQGACADLALQGKRSTVYVDGECPDVSDVDETVFGPIVPVPENP